MHQKIHQLVEIRVFSAFPSIYKGLDENTTVPVISSVVNTTDLAGPAINITAGLDMLVKEVTKQVMNMVVNTTNTTINPAIRLHHREESGGAPVRGVQPSSGDGVYILTH